ncbi:MAG: BrnT family toxin [Rhizomicrobium sp.]
MLDVGTIVRFEWDEDNVRKSADKHSVSQAEAEQVFFNDPLVGSTDDKHSSVEQRFHALGQTDAGRMLHITYAVKLQGAVIRVISARPMSRKERARYAEI